MQRYSKKLHYCCLNSFFFNNFAGCIINREMKKTILAAVMLACAVMASAQSGTKSPYSQFGLGALADQSAGFNRGMNGVGDGFREHNQVNYLNPASYSAIDSLSFIFDAGVSLTLTNFEEAGKKVNAKTANFEYAVAVFRFAKKLGLGFGIIPFTNIGYSYSNTTPVSDMPSPSSPNTTYTNTYSGSGGIHQAYLGIGWQPVKGFSVGVNGSYLWGDYSKDITNTYSDAYANTLYKMYKGEINSYKVDFGIQYSANVSKNDEATIGLVYGLGHSLNANPECMIVSMNSQTAVADTAKYSIKDGLKLPHTFGAGLAWNHKNQLRLGFDYQLQQWGELESPQYSIINNIPQYVLVKDQYKDRHNVNFGGEYCKGERYRSLFSRIHYRAGVSYATPYYKINGKDGPKELSISAGIGIPIRNVWNNRSMLNISGQWVNQKASGFINENSFRINIGFTFNERWFAKFKVD